MSEEEIKRKQLEWKLYKIMADRRIKSIAELRRRLETVGIEITSTQLGRMHFDRPSRLNLELLEGLATVLDCELNDIMDFTTDGVVEPPKKKEKKEKAPEKVQKPHKEQPATTSATPVQEIPKAEVKTILTGVAIPGSEDRFADNRAKIGPRIIPMTSRKK
jgi:DNA-binding Xre family transcriptional regulator